MKASNQMSTTFFPTDEHMGYIENWLSEEQSKKNAGFYCNWNIINRAFSQKTIAMLLIKNQPICFAAWSASEVTSKIEIVETHPLHRRRGLGRILIEALFEHLRGSGYLTVDLHCEPASTEQVWKRMGFSDFPDVMGMQYLNTPDNKHLYKILVPSAISVIDPIPGEESIELWANEPYLANNEVPTWVWNPKYKAHSEILEFPIIFPAMPDWRVRWQKKGSILLDCKSKYFLDSTAHIDKYLLIQQLKTN